MLFHIPLVCNLSSMSNIWAHRVSNSFLLLLDQWLSELSRKEISRKRMPNSLKMVLKGRHGSIKPLTMKLLWGTWILLYGDLDSFFKYIFSQWMHFMCLYLFWHILQDTFKKNPHFNKHIFPSHCSTFRSPPNPSPQLNPVNSYFPYFFIHLSTNIYLYLCLSSK